MNINIWIWNHYATNMFLEKGGRHYWFANNLIKRNYTATIFTSNRLRRTEYIINTDKNKYTKDKSGDVPFVFIKTSKERGNGIDRIISMLSFYVNLFSVSNKIAEEEGKPDIILASSVHPLTLLAGIQVSKKFGIPCICEVRDPWPETLVALGIIKKSNFITKILYRLERYIYIKADALIFTFEHGYQYIIDKGWDKEISKDKVYYINNGVDLKQFDENKDKYKYEDFTLPINKEFKVIYTGSMGPPNRIDIILEAAKILKKRNCGDSSIQFILYGDGIHRNKLMEFVDNKNLSNVIFRGEVHKNFIPSILSNSNVNIITGNDVYLYKYGISANKFFEYLASSKPVISNLNGHQIINDNKCGIWIKGDSPEHLAEAILEICDISKDDYENYSKNARKLAEEYDFGILTTKLERIVQSFVKEKINNEDTANKP